MPYPPGHREEVRAKIVQSARKLFNRSGFDNVSVDQIMADAGLTRGGFYTYFESKSDLYAEALACFFTDPGWKSRWEGVEVDLNAADVGPKSFARIYPASTLKTSTTRVPWSRCRAMLRAPAKARSKPLRRCSRPWSKSWSAARRMETILLRAPLRPSPLCASVEWWSPGRWTIVRSPTISAKPAWR